MDKARATQFAFRQGQSTSSTLTGAPLHAPPLQPQLPPSLSLNKNSKSSAPLKESDIRKRIGDILNEGEDGDTHEIPHTKPATTSTANHVNRETSNHSSLHSNYHDSIPLPIRHPSVHKTAAAAAANSSSSTPAATELSGTTPRSQRFLPLVNRPKPFGETSNTIDEIDQSRHTKNAKSLQLNVQVNSATASSLLANESDIQYIEHLRKNRISFYDTMGRMEFHSHISQNSPSTSDLFSNRNVLVALSDHPNSNNIASIPKKYDHIHVTEAIIPSLFVQSASTSKEKTAKPQSQPPSLLQSTFSSKMNSVNSQKKYLLTSNTHRSLLKPSTPPISRSSSQRSVNTNRSGHTITSNRFDDVLQFKFKPIGSQGSSDNVGELKERLPETRDIVRQLLNTSLLSRQQHESRFLNGTVSTFASAKTNPEVKNQITKRQEVENVRKWMGEKLDDLLKKEHLSVNQIFTYFQNVFQASLSELIRQIGTECKDRGDVLQEIWDNQVSLSEKIFIQLSNENSNVEKTSLKEINRLHKHYQFELQKCFSDVDAKAQALDETKKTLFKSIQENRLIRKKGQKLEKNFKVINNQINQLQEEYNMLFQENLALLMHTKQITWEQALAQKKMTLEEINLNRKMRNALIKSGDEQLRKDKFSMEELTKKKEIDEIVKQYVIDRESNLPIEFVEDVEPYEEDENHVVQLVDFTKSEATDTSDLIPLTTQSTNTDKVYTNNVKVQTTIKQFNDTPLQTDPIVVPKDDFYVQTDASDQMTQVCQTDAVETFNMMVQCSILLPGVAAGDTNANLTIQNQQQQQKKNDHPIISIGIPSMIGSGSNRREASANNQMGSAMTTTIPAAFNSTNPSNPGEKTRKSVPKIPLFMDHRGEGDDDHDDDESEVSEESNQHRQQSQQQQQQDHLETVEESRSGVFITSETEIIQANQKEINPNPARKSAVSLHKISKLNSIESTHQSDQASSIQGNHNNLRLRTATSPSSVHIQSEKKLAGSSNSRNPSREGSRSIKPNSKSQIPNKNGGGASIHHSNTGGQQQKGASETSISHESIALGAPLVRRSSSKQQLTSTSTMKITSPPHVAAVQQLKAFDSLIKVTPAPQETLAPSSPNDISDYSSDDDANQYSYDEVIEQQQEGEKQLEILKLLDKDGSSSNISTNPDTVRIKQYIDTILEEKNALQRKLRLLLQNQSQVNASTVAAAKSDTNKHSFNEHHQQQQVPFINVPQRRDSQNSLKDPSSTTSISVQNPSNSNSNNNLLFAPRTKAKKISIFSNQQSHTNYNSDENDTSGQGSSNHIIIPSVPAISLIQPPKTPVSDPLIVPSFQQKRNYQIDRMQIDQRRGSNSSSRIESPGLLAYINNNNSNHVNSSDCSTPQSARHMSIVSGGGGFSSVVKSNQAVYVSSPAQSKRVLPTLSNKSSASINDSPLSPQPNQRSSSKAYSINTEPALVMKRRMATVQKHEIKSAKNMMKFLPQILKMINSIMADNFKQIRSNEIVLNPLFVQVYEYFLYLFGLRKVAEIKLTQLVEQCILMKDEFKVISVFLSIYFNDLKSTEWQFFCRAFSLLAESHSRVEKSLSNKLKIINSIPLLFEEIETRDTAYTTILEQEATVALAALSNETNAAALLNEKVEVFEIMPRFLEVFQTFKEMIAHDYFSAYFAIFPSTENALIDEEGVQILGQIAKVAQTQMVPFLQEFRQKSIMNEMSYEQFILIASRHSIFKTRDIIAANSSSSSAATAFSLTDIRKNWLEYKTAFISHLIYSSNYSFYMKNVVEKLDTLTALLATDDVIEEQNNMPYIEANHDTYVISHIIALAYGPKE